jgi:hypothetical protein
MFVVGVCKKKIIYIWFLFGKIVTKKEFNMKTYKIKSIKPGSLGVLVELGRGAKESRWVEIYPVDAATKKLSVGSRITVLRDKYLDIEDYVYVYRGGMCFHTVPGTIDKYGCKVYLASLPGFFDYGKLDRAIFKRALRRECERQKLPVSFVAWHNLQNIMMARMAQNNKLCR